MWGELQRFGLVGLANVGVDLGVYTVLLTLGAPFWLAKGAAFVCGTLFAFVANKHFTFGARARAPGEFGRFILLYGTTMTLNVASNSLVLLLAGTGAWGRTIAYVIATGLSAAANFAGMRALFRPRNADVWSP